MRSIANCSFALGFEDDAPLDLEVLRHFRDCQGQWTPGHAYPPHLRQYGRKLLEELVASGPVSGFKDPRTVLTWPFWRNVLRDFPGLRAIGVFLLRSPHEIAMSMFQRSKGICGYEEALDIVAVHYRRMQEIFNDWRGDRAVLQFEPQLFAKQAPHLMELCGLKWDESALAEVYDPACRHHRSESIAHEAQTLFERLGGGEARTPEPDDMHKLLAHADVREQMLRQHCAIGWRR